MIAPPPLSLYVHLPWCVRKCPYCDFNSYALKGALPESEYLEALERDLSAQAPPLYSRRIVSVFFGGGTPSLFSPGTIARFLETARRVLAFENGAEITLEANPGTIERGRFGEYRSAGVTRVSLGAQSFDAGQLTKLGRIHSSDETGRAAGELHAAGLANFNLDLMYGLPGQTVEQARADVDAALALEPAHLSHYQLTIEPGTVFAAQTPVLPDEDVIDAMLGACQERLDCAGFARYEISAYARPGRRCEHNLNYWRFGDYVGVGAGAHGKLTEAASGRVVRTWQMRDPRRYMRCVPEAVSRRPIPSQDLPFEYLMNALRLLDGFNLDEFERRTGLSREAIAPELERQRRRGLLEPTRSLWRPSPLGLRFLNDLISAFLTRVGPTHGEAGPVNAGQPLYTASGARTANERIT